MPLIFFGLLGCFIMQVITGRRRLFLVAVGAIVLAPTLVCARR